MFDNLYMNYSDKRVKIISVHTEAEDHEQWHLMPAVQIEELPQGLIEDEI